MFNVLQLLFSACVEAVICRLVLNHCLVIIFWSYGIMDCMLFTSHALEGVSGVAYFVAIEKQLQ